MAAKAKFFLFPGLIYLFFIAGCSTDSELVWHQENGYRWAEVSGNSNNNVGFQKLASSRTNIKFRNDVSPALKDQNRHFLNGSGVAVADIDNDGLQDIYFARIDGQNKLYRNLGGYRFEDITEKAGLGLEEHTSTGVVFADINGNGFPDLLITSLNNRNLLFINDGEGNFTQKQESGLGESKGSYTMALADINGNGYLDLYITNYKIQTIRDTHSVSELTMEKTVYQEDGKMNVRDEFKDIFKVIETENGPYRNEIAEPDELYLNLGGGKFTRVNAREYFFDEEGNPTELPPDWGLTASFRDVNADGFPDLYVANDFWTPDRFWINQGDGTFRKIARNSIRNLSFSAMGVDFSDINRDGHLDIVVTEMLSSSHTRRLKQFSDYLPEFEGRTMHNRNSVYGNRGDGTDSQHPSFAQIAYYTGLEASEWSWATSFMDIDLDGYEDVIVATGFSNDYQDLDTQIALYEIDQGMHRSGGDISDYPGLRLPNKIFKNNQNLTFSDVSKEWGFLDVDISMGMALADLNNNGTLDVIMNRLDDEAAIYRNVTENSRIAVNLKGKAPNTAAIGAKIELKGGPVTQSKELFAGGSYLSGSQPMAVFAASANNENHQIKITWPDGTMSLISQVQANRIYEMDQESLERIQPKQTADEEDVVSPMFEDISESLAHQHHENNYDDFRFSPLLPMKLSRFGPGVAWLDVNNNGQEELIITSGKDGEPGIFTYNHGEDFLRLQSELAEIVAAGDQTAVAGWREGDKTRVVIGSANYEQGNPNVPSAFIYTLENAEITDIQEIPGVLSTTGAVTAADYTGDGFPDLFIGGRHKPGQYPVRADSRIFKNVNGEFVVDEKNSELFSGVGLVTDALFADITANGWQDLLLSTEWGTIKLFENRNGVFFDISEEAGLSNYKGWWTGITVGDFTGNGLADIVALNIGRNSAYQLRNEEPLRMYYDDFDWNGRLDILETYYSREVGSYVPRRQLYDFESVRILLTNIHSHEEFANSSVEKIFGQPFDDTSFHEINTLEHMLFINNDGKFEANPLPVATQFSMAFFAGTADFDNDGNEDLFISQNFFGFASHIPRLDAGRGLILKGNGDGTFQPLTGSASGIQVYGEQRGATLGDFNKDGATDIVVSQNNGVAKVYKNQSNTKGICIQLVGGDSNRDAIGSSLRIKYTDGSYGPRRFVNAGGSYASQNSFIQIMGIESGKTPESVDVQWYNGQKEVFPIQAVDESGFVIKLEL